MFPIWCAGFDSGTDNFLHNSCYGAICAENSIINMGMFLLLLSSAYIEPRPCLLTLPQQWADWGCTKGWDGASQDNWPWPTRWIFHIIWHHGQHIKLGEEEWNGMFRVLTSVFPKMFSAQKGGPKIDLQCNPVLKMRKAMSCTVWREVWRCQAESCFAPLFLILWELKLF